MKISLIGMMGSGKTTIGRKIAEQLDLEFCCTDEYIEEKENMTISSIFDRYGELYFRELEEKAIKKLSKKNNIVLSTGGGIVLNKNNIKCLIENKFIIIYLNREIERISENINIDSRPLLKENPLELEKLYNNRRPLYEKYSNITYKNNNDIDFDIKNLMLVIKNFKSGEKIEG